MIADTVCSLQRQTVPPDEIFGVDDYSDDGTGDVAGTGDARAAVFEPERGAR